MNKRGISGIRWNEWMAICSPLVFLKKILTNGHFCDIIWDEKKNDYWSFLKLEEQGSQRGGSDQW